MDDQKSRYLTLDTAMHSTRIGIGPYQKLFESFKPAKRQIFLTDENIFRLYTDFLGNKECITIPPGEKNKRITELLPIYRKLIDLEIDKSCFLVGMGGGVVTDISGFIASTFMRGISFGFISTSLLGQVDAVIGGKNGVNLDGYKNLIGTINQPDFIINDPAFFRTLPDKDFINGTAEVIKQFVIADSQSFFWLMENVDLYLEKDPDFLSELIYRQSRIKTMIVSNDEKEKGMRKILNYGHTIGHAIERETGMAHGFAVAIGMHYASRISELFGDTESKTTQILDSLLTKCGLPLHTDLPLASLLNTIKKDKKKKNDSIDFVILQGIGKATTRNISFPELEEILNKL